MENTWVHPRSYWREVRIKRICNQCQGFEVSKNADVKALQSIWGNEFESHFKCEIIKCKSTFPSKHLEQYKTDWCWIFRPLWPWVSEWETPITRKWFSVITLSRLLSVKRNRKFLHTSINEILKTNADMKHFVGPQNVLCSMRRWHTRFAVSTSTYLLDILFTNMRVWVCGKGYIQYIYIPFAIVYSFETRRRCYFSSNWKEQLPKKHPMEINPIIMRQKINDKLTSTSESIQRRGGKME